MGQHDQRHVMMPAVPTATLIVIQPEFLFELLIVLLDLPTGLGHLYQPAETVGGGQITEEVFDGLGGLLRPFHQQPDLFAGLTTLMKPVGGLHTSRPEARFQPAFAALPPTNFLPTLSRLCDLFNRDGPLLTVVQRTGGTPHLPGL